MSTDRERQEATSLWTVSHLEQRVRELTAQLAAVTARAEKAEAKLLELRLALGAAVERANRLAIWADRYGADQWRRGNAGQEPQDVDEWPKEAQP